MPTRENIAKICQDCKAQLYDSYYFNFITPISRMLLEDLAKAALEANCVDQISKVKQFLQAFSVQGAGLPQEERGRNTLCGK